MPAELLPALIRRGELLRARPQTEKPAQCLVNGLDSCRVDAPDARPKLHARHGRGFIHHNLGALAQARPLTGNHRDPERGRIVKLACQGQHDHRWMLVKCVVLYRRAGRGLP